MILPSYQGMQKPMGAAAFNPASLSPLFWLEADALSLGNGDAVATWTDLSGNGNDFAQGTSANRPTFRTNIINGLAAIEFDGTNDEVTNSTSFFDSSGSDATIFVVARRLGGNLTAGLICNRASGWVLRYSGDNLQYFHTGFTTLTRSLTSTNWNIMAVRRDGLDVEIGHNGTLAAAAGMGGYSAGSVTRIGNQNSVFLNAYVAAVFAVGSVLTNDQMAEMWSYFNDKYAIY